MGITIQYDYRNCLAAAIGPERGLTGEELCKFAPTVVKALAEIQQEKSEGKHSFLELPYLTDDHEFLKKEAIPFLQTKFENLAVLGIGGSALSMSALCSALKFSFERVYGCSDKPQLFVIDNIDPELFGHFLKKAIPEKTLFLIISKSGTTAETVAQFQILRGLLRKYLGEEEHKKRILVISDPETPLSRVAAKLGYKPIRSFPQIGGRFSLLTPIALLPSMFFGINTDELLEGARDMEEACRSESLVENPALQFATVHFLLNTTRRMPLFVHFAYSERLRGFSDWFRQLFAESLGKRRDLAGRDIFVGPTPVSALGVTDQHSQVQLYVEGPFDKIFTFLSVKEFACDVLIPDSLPELIESRVLSGSTLGDLLHAEEQGTREALTAAGRPNGTIFFPQINEHAIGEYILLMELSVALLGKLYGIDPYDQPGVEAGKIAARRILEQKKR